MNSFHELFLSYFLLDMGYLSLETHWTFMCLHFSFSFEYLGPLCVHSLFFFDDCPCPSNLERIVMNNMEFIFCGMKWNGMILHNFRCRSWRNMWSVRDLDHGNMKCISRKGHNNLTKLKEATSCICRRF